MVGRIHMYSISKVADESAIRLVVPLEVDSYPLSRLPFLVFLEKSSIFNSTTKEMLL